MTNTEKPINYRIRKFDNTYFVCDGLRDDGTEPDDGEIYIGTVFFTCDTFEEAETIRDELEYEQLWELSAGKDEAEEWEMEQREKYAYPSFNPCDSCSMSPVSCCNYPCWLGVEEG